MTEASAAVQLAPAAAPPAVPSQSDIRDQLLTLANNLLRAADHHEEQARIARATADAYMTAAGKLTPTH